MLIKPVSLPRDVTILDSPVAYIRRSDIHLLTARRNAWHSTTLNHYRTTAPAFSTVMSAWAAAEGRRGPGTYFEIDEIPSLVFDLAGYSLVVIHLNASQPFSSWAIPETSDSDSKINGLDVFNMFAGSRHDDVASGWRISARDADVIVGIAETAALFSSNRRGKISLRRSSTQSNGELTFNIVRSTDAEVPHLERIIEELSHLTEQKYPVHEIYKWGGEYFCEEDTRKLYDAEPRRLINLGSPERLTEAPENPTFCAVCFRWFSAARPHTGG